MNTILIKKALTDEDMKKCLEIRFQVFVEGQHVPIEEELDGKDSDSVHYLLFQNNHPVGVARVRSLQDFSKIERVAILDAYQRQGLGRDIMNYILSDLRTHSTLRKVMLCSQSYAVPFYEALGFEVCSDEYINAGIPHKDMQLML